MDETDEIVTRTVFALYIDGERFQFDGIAEGHDAVKIAFTAACLDEGCISWGPDEVPATPFDELIAEYIDNLHGIGGGADEIDRALPYLLVEENVRGGYWLTSHESVESAVTTHDGDEYAHEWEIVGIFDQVTGNEVDYEVTKIVTVKS